jgi:hypothetical protein
MGVLGILLAMLSYFALRTKSEATELTPTAFRVSVVEIGEVVNPTVTPLSPSGSGPNSFEALQGVTDADKYLLTYSLSAAGDRSHDPVSFEMGSLSFVLGEGEVAEGLWSPQGAEWLNGTILGKSVALPLTEDLEEEVLEIRDAIQQNPDLTLPVYLRLRSGEVVTYIIERVERIKRHQIEVFTPKYPSLVILTHDERSTERWVLVARAHQATEDLLADFNITASNLTDAGIGKVNAVLTFIDVPEGSRQVDDSAGSGLVLEVVACDRYQQINDIEPESGEYMMCYVSLEAGRDRVSYSGAALSITERKEHERRADWWPPVVAINDAIGDGTLSKGEKVDGFVAGIVTDSKDSDAVLIWEVAGKRYILTLEEE